LRDCLNTRGVWINTNHKYKALPLSLFETAQEEEQIEWTRDMIEALEIKHGAKIKSNSIPFLKAEGTLEERRARRGQIPPIAPKHTISSQQPIHPQQTTQSMYTVDPIYYPFPESPASRTTQPLAQPLVQPLNQHQAQVTQG